MADKDTPIYDKTRMRGTTWVDATRILFNMGSELEEQIDGMDYEGVKQDLADEIINRQNADTQLGNRIDTLGTQVNQNKSDITQIKETINQIEDNATALGASVAELQTDVIEAQADIEGIKTSLVSDVITKGGITTGTIVVEIEREDGTKITAEDFNYGKPTSMELLQGSSEGMMKAQFTLSDGTTIQSNDFQILEMVSGDLYITSFTFKNGSSQGKISADIGLSDGRTLKANDFQLPTDPQVTQNIASLLSRMTAVEEKNSQQDTELSSLDARVKAIEDTPGISKFELGKLGTIMGSSDNGKINANPDGTGSVNGWDSVASVNDISDLQEQVTGLKLTSSGNTMSINGTNANIINSISGQVTGGNLKINVNGIESDNIQLPSVNNSGLIDSLNWEEIDLSSFPTDFIQGEYIKVCFFFTYSIQIGNNTADTVNLYTQNNQSVSNNYTEAVFRLTNVNTFSNVIPIFTNAYYNLGDYFRIENINIRPNSVNSFNSQYDTATLFELEFDEISFKGNTIYRAHDSVEVRKNTAIVRVYKMYRATN